MKRVIRIPLFILLLCMGIGSFAQDDTTETFTFADSAVTIDYPATWSLTENDNDTITLSTDNLSLLVFDPVALASNFDFDAADSAEDALAELAPQLLDDADDFDADLAIFDTIDEREMARFDIEQVSLIVVSLSDETFGMVQATRSQDEAITDETLLLDVLSTFDSAADGLSLDLNIAELSQAVCNVSTTEANMVQVRVGPGTNRTVVSFLPANTEFAVLGKSTTDDNTLWFKLDKEEAAPGKSVNETWILADSVAQDGECDAIADAAAPPIIPFIVQPAANAAGDDIDVATFITPNSGTWRYVIGDVFVSCPNGMTLTVPSNIPVQTVAVASSGQGDISLDLSIYPSAAPNTYTYSDSVVIDGDPVSTSVTVVVTSETTMSGTLTFNVQGCTGTAPLTISRS